MLSDITIKALSNEVSYQRGLFYYRNHAVRELTERSAHPPTYSAEVHGSHDYYVAVRLNEKGNDVTHLHCGCPAATAYLGICKHGVAVLKEIQALQQRKAKGKGGSVTSGARMLALFAATGGASAPATAPAQTVFLEPTLVSVNDYGHTEHWLEFRLGSDKRLYVVKDIPSVLRDVDDGHPVTFGKNFTLLSDNFTFGNGSSQKLWDLLYEAYRESNSVSNRRGSYGYGYGYRSVSGDIYFDKKRFLLTPAYFKAFLNCMKDASFIFNNNGVVYNEAKVMEGEPRLTLKVADLGKKGADVSLAKNSLEVIDDNCLRQEGNFYTVSPEFMQNVTPLLKSFSHDSTLRLTRDETAIFFGSVMPQIEKIADVEVADTFQEKYVMEPLRAEFYFDYHGDGIEVRPNFRYGDISFNPLKITELHPRKGKTLVRENAAEQELLNLFHAYSFEENKGLFIQDDEDKSYDFLVDALPELADKADVYYSEALQKKPVQRMAKVTAGVSVNDDNLLEVTFNTDEVDFDELMDILASYRQKRRYHRLKDGTFITLEEQQLASLSDLVDHMGIRKGAKGVEDMTVKLPLSQAMYLDSLAKEEESLQLERSKKFRAIVRDIRHPEDSEVEVPQSLKKVLRDYQRVGFRWLTNLSQYGLGGILADDMGLGKTLQVIAFLLAKKEEVKLPSLVVAPTSLMYNWLDEIERFAPELKAAAVAGTKEERQNSLEDLPEDLDVIITTYNMLKRDIDIYEQKKFAYCFLDEAQHIKNPSTQNAKSVKRLNTNGYFALTGTPIENTLTELWSIFDYLMPGYLGNHTKFKQRYEIPIVRGEDEHASQDLRRRVLPFILRRMKKDVLKELPDKVENRMLSDMTAEQKKVYQAYFVQGQKEFAAEMKARGFAESRIKILAILTRLRQIACDPTLFLEDYHGGSGKLDMLEEVVGEAVNSGHRLLIFSQFTTMLGHIADRLKQVGIGFYYLDGQTPAKERMRLVKSFNGGATPIFLISLKAGGTGLNLTGADMVIHYDPWWNPAVEDQATDRAYRLGQQKNVQVLKFITKGTIEEKIYKLQEKKKSLIDQMIKPGENFLSKLTEEEIRNLFVE
ncbi:MAG: DEAD/DEAH box helicase [Selenomonadaceae bacterium]|nr:DEAD/DEAH box helicase [Selenomonadaceae bacterium]